MHGKKCNLNDFWFTQARFNICFYFVEIKADFKFV